MATYTGPSARSYYSNSWRDAQKPYRQTWHKTKNTPFSLESRARLDSSERGSRGERRRNSRPRYVLSSPEWTEETTSEIESPSHSLEFSIQKQLASQSASKAQQILSSVPAAPHQLTSATSGASSKSEPSTVFSIPRAPYVNDVKFLFFVSDESCGAIEKSFDQCESLRSFFDEAISAWDTIGGHGRSLPMAGVSIAIKPLPRSIFVPWCNKEGFERLMESISKESMAMGKNLEVEVRCRPLVL